MFSPLLPFSALYNLVFTSYSRLFIMRNSFFFIDLMMTFIWILSNQEELWIVLISYSWCKTLLDPTLLNFVFALGFRWEIKTEWMEKRKNIFNGKSSTEFVIEEMKIYRGLLLRWVDETHWNLQNFFNFQVTFMVFGSFFQNCCWTFSV